MDINDFKDGTLWAITPQALDNIIETVPKIMAMETAGKDMLMGMGRVKDRKPDYEIRDGIAIIPVSGTISKQLGFWDMIFGGGASLARIRADMDSMLADPVIRGAVLYIDSPGGRVSGVSEMAEFVFSAREKKPIVAYSDGDITSAATFIGSAATKKMISPTANDGSIGVITLHVDASRMLDRVGYKYTYLTAGKYKALGNPVEPLTEEARNMITDRLNVTYGVFINSIAKFRNVSEDTVRETMANGRIFVGQQAVDIGLADSLGSLEDAVAMVMDLAGCVSHQGKFYINLLSQVQEERRMPTEIKTVEDLKKAFPELTDQLAAQAQKQGAESVDTGPAIEAAVKEAEKTTAERICGLASLHFGKDHGDKFAGIVNEGFTVGQYGKVIEAMGGKSPFEMSVQAASDAGDDAFKKQMLENLQQSGAQDVGTNGDGKGPQTWEDAVSAIMTEQNCSRGQAIKRAVQLYPELHQKYVEALRAA